MVRQRMPASGRATYNGAHVRFCRAAARCKPGVRRWLQLRGSCRPNEPAGIRAANSGVRCSRRITLGGRGQTSGLAVGCLGRLCCAVPVRGGRGGFAIPGDR